MTDADHVAECVLDAFQRLPPKFKPRCTETSREWTVLCGIVLEDSERQCVALGTGLRCLPAAKVAQAGGKILHDWHAEVVALRAFNAFLMAECHANSRWIRERTEKELEQMPQRFVLRDNIRICMYSSEVPCGDASMELTMAQQHDPTPWAGPGDSLPGRGYFSQLGVVRRKPARADAPISLSKSCSDKLAAKQCLSLLSSPASVLISPANCYLSVLVIPVAQFVQVAMDRCFTTEGRFANINEVQAGGYSFRPFVCTTTDREFEFCRGGTGSNIAAVWNPHGSEVLINGVKQGHKQLAVKGASMLSRWAFLHTLSCKGINFCSYRELKSHHLLAERRQVKVDLRSTALKGWVCNEEQDFAINGTVE